MTSTRIRNDGGPARAIAGPRKPADAAVWPDAPRVIVLPLPPISLKSNRTMGQHWSNQHGDKKAYQAACRKAVKHRIVELRLALTAWPIHLRCVAYVGKNMRRPDCSDVGTWGKAAIDSMVPEIFPNDSPRYIRPFTADVGRDWANPRLELSW